MPPTQSSLKKQNGKYQPNTLHKWFFGSVLMSPIQMGSLSVNNSVTNFSRLGTFKDPRHRFHRINVRINYVVELILGREDPRTKSVPALIKKLTFKETRQTRFYTWFLFNSMNRFFLPLPVCNAGSEPEFLNF